MSILLAHIAPIGVTEEAIKHSSFNMVLAHVAEDSNEYCKLFKDSDKPTLLDNGAFELGYPMDVDDMIAIGHKVGADTIVLPDFPYSAWDRGWLTVLDDILTYKDAGFKTMFIPQSLHNDAEGYFRSLEQALEHPSIDYIGLSILGVPNAGLTRVEILEKYKNWTATKKRFHMLGCLNDPIAEMVDISADYSDMVNSWDTSAAVWKGLHDKLLFVGNDKFKLAVHFSSPLPWTDHATQNVEVLNAAIR